MAGGSSTVKISKRDAAHVNTLSGHHFIQTGLGFNVLAKNSQGQGIESHSAARQGRNVKLRRREGRKEDHQDLTRPVVASKNSDRRDAGDAEKKLLDADER